MPPRRRGGPGGCRARARPPPTMSDGANAKRLAEKPLADGGQERQGAGFSRTPAPSPFTTCTPPRRTTSVSPAMPSCEVPRSSRGSHHSASTPAQDDVHALGGALAGHPTGFIHTRPPRTTRSPPCTSGTPSASREVCLVVGRLGVRAGGEDDGARMLDPVDGVEQRRAQRLDKGSARCRRPSGKRSGRPGRYAPVLERVPEPGGCLDAVRDDVPRAVRVAPEVGRRDHERPWIDRVRARERPQETRMGEVAAGGMMPSISIRWGRTHRRAARSAVRRAA